MSAELINILLTLGGMAIGWIIRHRMGPSPVPSPAPAPNPAPSPAPAPSPSPHNSVDLQAILLAVLQQILAQLNQQPNRNPSPPVTPVVGDLKAHVIPLHVDLVPRVVPASPSGRDTGDSFRS